MNQYRLTYIQEVFGHIWIHANSVDEAMDLAAEGKGRLEEDGIETTEFEPPADDSFGSATV